MRRLISSLEHQRYFDNISSFSADNILHIYDVFDQDYIDTIILPRGTPDMLISDHFIKAQFNGVEVIGLPLWAEFSAKYITEDLQWNDEMHTDVAFNFMVNKQQINRFLCIKLVELFELKDFNYTWNGLGRELDMTCVISELNNLGSNSPLDTVSSAFILQPIKLPKMWIEYPTQKTTDYNSVKNYGGNRWTWQNGLDKMFSRSAISLITESVWTQTASVLTEKTLYSILGLTFPIWVGGYEQAKELARIGFDTFDDVIDHSYQSYDTLTERCYYAFAKNIDLLSNVDKLRKIRLQHKQRLLENRKLLLGNKLEQFVDKQIESLPFDLQQVMPDILKRFRGQNTVPDILKHFRGQNTIFAINNKKVLD